jgi:hypothetical protein
VARLVDTGVGPALHRQQQRELLRSLGILPSEEPTEPEEPIYPAFDGGPREPAPLPRDPGREHDNTILEIV